MDFELAKMTPVQLTGRWMVRTLVSETTSNSRFQRSRISIQATGATRLKTRSSTLSPTTSKSDRMPRLVLISFIFLKKSWIWVSHSARSNSRECDGRCKHHTNLYARRRTFFSCALHSAPIHTALLFSNVGTPHWLKVKRSLCHVFVYTHFHLACHVIVERSFCPFPSDSVLTNMPCFKNLSDLNLVWWQ